MKKEIKDVFIEQGFDQWTRGSAAMMASVASLRVMKLMDDEETDDLLRRLSAIVMQGATAFGKENKCSLEEFMDGLTKLHSDIVKKGFVVTEQLEELIDKK